MSTFKKLTYGSLHEFVAAALHHRWCIFCLQNRPHPIPGNHHMTTNPLNQKRTRTCTPARAIETSFDWFDTPENQEANG